MRPLIARAYLAALLLALALPASAFDMSEVETGVFRVVNVQNGQVASTGSGFAVSGRYLLTNEHVTRGADQLNIVSPQFDEAVKVQLVEANRDYDISLLRVDGRSLDALTLSTRAPEPGDAVFAVGYPGFADVGGLDLEDPVTVTGGVFSRTYRQPWGYRDRELVSLQHNADISPGNSGGPLVDACNRVIGVNTRGVSRGAQGLFWASSMRYGLEVMRDNGVKVEALSSACDTSGAGALDEVRKAQAAAEKAAAGNQALRTTMLRWGAIGLAGVIAALVVAFLVISAIVRRQNENLRQAMKRVAEPVSRPFRRGGTGPRFRDDGNSALTAPHRERAGRRTGLMLTGIGPDGRPLRVELDAATLATSGDGYCIGRHPELVDTAIDDERVSRRHARFTSDGATIHVEDLNSTAGTMVNRNPIDPFAPARLQPGDKVVLGGLELVASQR
jgi:hypothetical protein